MKPVILYRSKYGATKQYAGLLSKALGCDCMINKGITAGQLTQYDTVILGGGLYAGHIAGVDFLKKNYPLLMDKKIAVFAVGAAENNDTYFRDVRKNNLTPEMKGVPLFYCRGSWDEDKLSWPHKMMIKAMRKMVFKQETAEAMALIDALKDPHNWVTQEQLAPIVAWVAREEGI